ncbi:uncharacterized protein [Triticum aestivum]|uniref:uncharacterized protein n=1 Tax=Triticum aestivum TaxID=4565 RepID=UPI001D01CBC8|nr:uncharacterized protein LOC123134826 [Triticum aestivum]
MIGFQLSLRGQVRRSIVRFAGDLRDAIARKGETGSNLVQLTVHRRGRTNIMQTSRSTRACKTSRAKTHFPRLAEILNMPQPGNDQLTRHAESRGAALLLSHWLLVLLRTVRYYRCSSVLSAQPTYTARSMMYRRITARLLVVAAVVLLSLLLASCAAVPRGLGLPPPRPPPVLLLGGGRSPAREGMELDLGTPARRLGQQTSTNVPPSPKPHGNSGSAGPDTPPSSNE